MPGSGGMDLQREGFGAKGKGAARTSGSTESASSPRSAGISRKESGRSMVFLEQTMVEDDDGDSALGMA